MLNLKKSIVIFASFLILSCTNNAIRRDTLPREIAFSKILVLPLITFNYDESQYSEYAQELLIKEIIKNKKFRVVSFSKTRSILNKLNLYGKDYQTPESLSSISEASGADAVLCGLIAEDRIELRLYSPMSGMIFYSVSEEVDQEFNQYSIKAILHLLTRRLLGFVPFDALLVAAKGDMVKISAGSASGLVPGSNITIFEITTFRRTRDGGGEYEKYPIALAKIIKVKKDWSIGKIIKHNSQFQIEKFNKVSFMNFFIPIEASGAQE